MHHPHRQMNGPRLIAWELTRSCPLHCRHCRAAAESGTYEGELSFEEVCRVLDNVAEAFSPIMILTGGEPLLRPDIYDIARYAKGLGLRPVLATCGTLLTEDCARKLVESGIERISVSIDGPDAESHDSFRGVDGAFNEALEGLAAANRAGLEFQINTTVTKLNFEHIESIYKLAIKLGAVAFHPFLLVPTGRGKDMQEHLLDPIEYEQALIRIYKMRNDASIPLKPTCAPHYYRVLRQKEAAAGRDVTPQTHGLDAMSKGCMGGISFAFISHRGVVQICGFLEEEAGDLRAANFDFQQVWRDSPLFKEVREQDNYKGACGACEYWHCCGGCRARAMAIGGDYLGEEPFCTYTPESLRAGVAEA